MHRIYSFWPEVRRAAGLWAVALLLCLVLAPCSSDGAESTSKSQPSAQRSEIPGGSLEANEKGGGHLLSRHVGKTAEELRQRLQSDSKISAASSFTDREVAAKSISSALAANKKRINAWLKGGEDRMVFSHRNDLPVGISMSRGSTKPRAAYRIRLVLVRDKKFEEGWKILTGYPEL